MAYISLNKNYSWYQHYQLAWFRKLVVKFRFHYYTKVQKRLRTFENYNSGEDNNTIHHNLKGLIYASGTRVLSLLHPLSAIEILDRRTARVLSIGPRTEGELYLMLGLGFQKPNIKAIDLISYSPWIELGDMHNLPYANNSFDCIIMGWVLAYSPNPKLAAKNVIDKAANNAIVAISVEYSTDLMDQEYKAEFGYHAGHTKRIRHTNEILELFENNVAEVYLRYDIANEHKDKAGNIIVIFSIRK